MTPKEKIYRGSKNIFADIGLPYSERVKARADIMLAIIEIIRERGLTQEKAGAILDIPQSKVSGLMNGKLSLFSLDHLLQFLNALNTNVNIVLNREEKRPAITQVIRERACLSIASDRSMTWKALHITLKYPTPMHRIKLSRAVNISQPFSAKKYSIITSPMKRAREKAGFTLISGVIQ
jgi:predicted XRE-type DNA-binding protein